jgi:hypothetical protein
MTRKNKRPRYCKVLFGVLLTVTLVASTMLFSGCVTFGKTPIYPLEDDFKLVNAGETIVVKKQGAIVSDFWLSKVGGFEVVVPK